MTDVEYSPDGTYFVVSTTGAYGGAAATNAGTSGCDVVTRFEDNATPTSTPTWTAYTGSDTTWTVEVTDRRRLRRRPPEVPEQPERQQRGRPRRGEPRGHRRARPGQRDAVLLEPDPRPRCRRPGHPGDVRRALRRVRHRRRSATRPATPTTPRIAVLPLTGGKTLPPLAPTTLPVNIYRVASGASQLTSRTFNGTTAGTATNAPNGPGWSTSTGAFMVNGVLYKLSSDGTSPRCPSTAAPTAPRSRWSPVTSWSSRPTGTPTPRR